MVLTLPTAWRYGSKAAPRKATPSGRGEKTGRIIMTAVPSSTSHRSLILNVY